MKLRRTFTVEIDAEHGTDTQLHDYLGAIIEQVLDVRPAAALGETYVSILDPSPALTVIDAAQHLIEGWKDWGTVGLDEGRLLGLTAALAAYQIVAGQ